MAPLVDALYDMRRDSVRHAHLATILSAVCRFWTGTVCEIIVFSAPLPTLYRQCVEAYLQAKWATPALPTP
jgi:hypothetical protein